MAIVMRIKATAVLLLLGLVIVVLVVCVGLSSYRDRIRSSGQTEPSNPEKVDFIYRHCETGFVERVE